MFRARCLSLLLLPATLAHPISVQSIENWSAPPAWSPQRVLAESDSEQAPKLAVPTSPLPFVGIPPCRIADTRGAGFPGAYGPPPLAAGASRNDLLERLAAIPIQTWNYVSQDSSIRHIGPVAQDFFAAFAVGEDERLISTVDADGVALAAIQGLYEVVRQKDARISALEARLAAVEHRLSETP